MAHFYIYVLKMTVGMFDIVERNLLSISCLCSFFVQYSSVACYFSPLFLNPEITFYIKYFVLPHSKDVVLNCFLLV